MRCTSSATFDGTPKAQKICTPDGSLNALRLGSPREVRRLSIRSLASFRRPESGALIIRLGSSRPMRAMHGTDTNCCCCAAWGSPGRRPSRPSLRLPRSSRGPGCLSTRMRRSDQRREAVSRISTAQTSQQKRTRSAGCSRPMTTHRLSSLEKCWARLLSLPFQSAFGKSYRRQAVVDRVIGVRSSAKFIYPL